MKNKQVKIKPNKTVKTARKVEKIKTDIDNEFKDILKDTYGLII